MKKKPSKVDILKIISKILKISPQKIEKIDDYTKMESWDSLAQLDIISAIDKKLNGRIGKIKNIAEIKSVKKIISLLKKKSLIT
jgi:acyl carrier protein|tara:strand:+ start:790 stop:1041 length:252 start_codon:yes stop_codon:yes gene_type:complete